MLTDVVSLSTIAVAVVALAALYFTWAQLRVLSKQMAQANRVAITQAYSEVSSATAEFDKLFLDHPEWHPYFYEGKEADSEDLELIKALDHICESLMDYVDVVIELRNLAPFSGMDWSTWETWFRFFYNNSPAFRVWALDNISICPDYELAVLGLIVMRDRLSGVVTEKWHACEYDENNASHNTAAQHLWAEDWKARIPEAGYPWVRMWMMRRIEDAEPSMLATVSITHPGEARVSVHWLSPPSHVHDPELLYSWIAGTLSGSKLIARVVVTTHLLCQEEGEITYQIRKSSAYANSGTFPKRYLLAQEPFLLPKYRPVSGRYSPHLRPRGHQLRQPSRQLRRVVNAKPTTPMPAPASTAVQPPGQAR
jgi:hypothetical protein